MTDGQGTYKIVELRPGTYTVAFALAGFNTVKREGVELSSSFTATINAELPAGATAETITLSDDSPVVDTQNVRARPSRRVRLWMSCRPIATSRASHR